MAGFDETIPLQGSQGFDTANFLAALQQGADTRQKQVQIQKQNALAGLLSTQTSFAPNGDLTPAARLSLNALSPQYALEYERQQDARHIDQLKMKAGESDLERQRLDLRASIAHASEKERKQIKDAGGTDQAAIDAATRVRNQLLDEGGSLLGADQVRAAKGQPYDTSFAGALAQLMPGEIQEE